MLEILITILIIAIAMLGAAGLQLYAMRVNKGGQSRTQAIFLASNIAERMEANKPAAVAGSYVLAGNGTPAALPAIDPCVAAACTSAQLAARDLNQWENAIVALLPQATSWQICIDANADNVCDAVQTPANPITYKIVINWTERTSNTSYAASDAATSTGLDAAGSGERFSYAATRSFISN